MMLTMPQPQPSSKTCSAVSAKLAIAASYSRALARETAWALVSWRMYLPSKGRATTALAFNCILSLFHSQHAIDAAFGQLGNIWLYGDVMLFILQGREQVFQSGLFHIGTDRFG